MIKNITEEEWKESYRVRSQKQRTPSKDIVELVESSGFKFICFEGEYLNGNSFITYDCYKGHRTTRQVCLFIRRKTCGICAHEEYAFRKINSIDKVLSILNNNGCEYVSGEYTGKNSLILVKFVNCGHIQKIYLDKIRARTIKGYCPDCAIQLKNDKRREKESNKIIDKIENAGFTFVSFPNEYFGNQSVVEYTCSLGHLNSKVISSFSRKPSCTTCYYINRIGESVGTWKGGRSPLRNYLLRQVPEWKIASAQVYDFRCAITGGEFEELHHLVSFSNILDEATNGVGVPLKPISEYSEEELNMFVENIRLLHWKYGFGIPLTKKVHRYFHKLYGTDGQTTPEDFYDYWDKLSSGEIQLPD